MKNFKFGLIAFLFFAGCAAPAQGVKNEKIYAYQYGKVVLMPFTGASWHESTVAQEKFYVVLAEFPDLKVIKKEKLDDEFVRQVGLVHADNVGVLDFSEEMGTRRRENLRNTLGADGLIFGSLGVEDEKVHLYIQMMKVDDGQLTLIFTKETEVRNNDFEAAIRTVSESAAQKVTDHIKGNVVVTTTTSFDY